MLLVLVLVALMLCVGAGVGGGGGCCFCCCSCDEAFIILSSRSPFPIHAKLRSAHPIGVCMLFAVCFCLSVAGQLQALSLESLKAAAEEYREHFSRALGRAIQGTIKARDAKEAVVVVVVLSIVFVFAVVVDRWSLVDVGGRCGWSLALIVVVVVGSCRWSLSLILTCLLYTSPSPRDGLLSRMPSSA